MLTRLKMAPKQRFSIWGAIMYIVEFRYWSILIGPEGCYDLSDSLKMPPLRNLTIWRNLIVSRKNPWLHLGLQLAYDLIIYCRKKRKMSLCKMLSWLLWLDRSWDCNIDWTNRHEFTRILYAHTEFLAPYIVYFIYWRTAHFCTCGDHCWNNRGKQYSQCKTKLRRVLSLAAAQCNDFFISIIHLSKLLLWEFRKCKGFQEAISLHFM